MPKIEHKLDEATIAREPAVRRHIGDLFNRLARADNARILNTSFSNYLDHPAGGCRMGTNPAASVCDSHGRTHDHPNLFLLGSGVFPTSAASNPTLTIAAL